MDEFRQSARAQEKSFEDGVEQIRACTAERQYKAAVDAYEALPEPLQREKAASEAVQEARMQG